ncbi:MAG: Ig-like domain-containing protein, partial [Pseudohongiellaceae bacterium]
AADDMVAFSAKTVGLSELVLIDDINVAPMSTENTNVAPIVAVANTTLTVPDSDNVAGEQVTLSGNASDSDGNLQSVQWLVNGQVVGSGTTAVFSLPDGLSTVVFRASDSDGLTASTAISVTVAAPTIPFTWPNTFAGTSPDPALVISQTFNNIGGLNSSDGRIYSCLKIYQNGSPSNLSGVPEFDIAFTVIDASQGIIQVANSRPFNTGKELASDGQLPSCSGTFELSTSEYSDVLQVGPTTYTVRFIISDPATLQMRLQEATPID